MKSFNKIWIPSVGKLCKFNEITHHQEKVILKSIAQHAGALSSFMYALNGIMQENSIEPVQFNVLDRLFYGIYTKAYCFTNELDYILKCPACNRQSKTNISLQNVINALEYLAYYQKETINIRNWQINLNVPEISKDIELRELIEAKKDTDMLNLLDHLIFISHIKMGNIDLNFSTLDFNSIIELFDNINKNDGEEIIKAINNYKSNIYKENSNDTLLNIKCICGETLLNFNLDGPSFDSFLMMIYNSELSTLYQKELNYRTLFPGSKVDDLAPIERDLLINMKNAANQQADAEPSDSGGLDLAKV